LKHIEKCNCIRCPQCSSALVNILSGIGIGILLSRPLAGDHPLRWGLAILALSLLGHLYYLAMDTNSKAVHETDTSADEKK
jgi:hypothetical protein